MPDDLPSSAQNALAVVHDYTELRSALRQRAEALDISWIEIDRISGISSGYSGAVLSETARKRIGLVNLGPILAALGLQLLVVENPDAMARYTVRAEKRIPHMARLGNQYARRAARA
jgi:hypothetical protein